MSDRPAWHALDVAARTEYLLNLSASPIAETERAGVTTVLTGVASNTLNGVCRARLDPAGADAVIAATIARFQDRQAPALWYVDRSDVPHDLPRRLQAAGCRPETTGVVRGGAVAHLLARTDELTAAKERARAAAVRPVRCEADLDRWFDVARDVFTDEVDELPGAASRWRDLLASLELSAAAPLQHWLAVEPDSGAGGSIGMASAFYREDTVLIDQDAVVAGARRRGVGAALVRACLIEATARGCRWAVVEPTPESGPFYDALGFDEERCGAGLEFYLPLDSEPPADSRTTASAHTGPG